MDLDGTVLDETFQPSPRTAAAIALRRGRRHRLPDRDRAHVHLGAPRRRAARHPPAARLLPGRARRRSRDAARCSCTGRSRRRSRARSCAPCPRSTRGARISTSTTSCTCGRRTRRRVRYSQVAGVPMHVVGAAGRLDRAADDQDRHRRHPETMDALRDELQPLFGSRAFIAKSLPYFLEFAAPGVSKASGLALVADLLGFTAAAGGRARRRRERPRDARLGRLRRSRSRTPTSALIGEADCRDPLGARRRRRAAARGARRCAHAARLRRMLDIRLIRSDTERVRAALARRGGRRPARRGARAGRAPARAADRGRRAARRAQRRRAGDRRGQARRARRGRGDARQPRELRDRAGRARGRAARRSTRPSRRAMLALPNLPHESAADGMREEDAQRARRVEPPEAGVRLRAARPPRPRRRA